MVNPRRTWLISPLSASLLLLFTSLLSTTGQGQTAAENSNFVPGDYILLNCGASGQLPDVDNRNWTGDIGSRFVPSSQNTLAATAAFQASSVPKVPYMTGRIFTTPFTYSFPVAPGRKFIRLYFYPSNYSIHAAADSRFAVTVQPGNFILMSNFSASQTVQALSFDYLSREFCVNVSTGFLNLTFTPSSNVPNAYAFVNGIEIVSMPDLFGSETLSLVGYSTTYTVDQTTALQTMYRLNVGGNDISPVNDVALYRAWANDTSYIFAAAFGVTYPKDPNVTINYINEPKYTAPEEVYATARSMGPSPEVNLNYNLTWLLAVDPGFNYLVRMHFCEIQYPITRPNQRVFSIYLNNQTAKRAVDVIDLSSGIGRPVYRDYIVLLQAGNDQQDLWVELHPWQQSKPEYYDAILNGLEVFKLSSFNGNLAGPNPIPPPQPNPVPDGVVRNNSQMGSSSKAPIVAGAMGGAVGAVLVVCVVVCWG